MTDLLPFPTLHTLGDLASPLPLEHTEVAARVLGLAAAVTVHQRFRNPLTAPADLEYLFPLPAEAAVTAFELRAGERVIRARIDEIAQAREQFETARQQGRRAGLLESRRPNLFALQLANIQPGETLEAVTVYQQRLAYSAGQVEFVFPMGLTPKYHRAGHPEEAQGVDAPLALDLTQVGDVAVTVEADTGLPSADPVSPSHPLSITRPAAAQFTVHLDGPHLPNHDFVLRWPAPAETVSFPAWHTPAEAGTFLATFLPPAADPTAAPLPREYIFVLDRSGSMSGAPIRQALNALRACLRSLNPQDTFAILLFDDQLEWLFPLEAITQAVTQAAVDAADQRLAAVDGRGGTEILPALGAALTLQPDPERTRIVIFLTDGAVSAETEALTQVRRQMGAARLFTFGIGPSVNRAFLQQLARIGRGQAEFIGLDEDIEEVILRFQDRLAFPQLTNLRLSAENGNLWDVYPAQLPDLYAGSPLEVVGRYRGEGAGPVRLVVTGERAGAPVVLRAALAAPAPDAALLPRLWARARVDDLEEQTALKLKPEHEARAEIIALALAHNLVTRYTAFVAVDSAPPAARGQTPLIHIAQPLPEGLELGGFVGSASFGLAAAAPPMMAAPAPRPGVPAPKRASRKAAAKLDAFATEDLNVPSFLRRREQPAPEAAETSALPAEPERKPAPDAAAILKELARTQKLNGAWEEEVELTAAALLAFVRHGHTTLAGHFRKPVARAAAWLIQAQAHGFAAWLRALALSELAAATRSAEQQAAAEQARQALPAPAAPLEAAAFRALTAAGQHPSSQKQAQSLDELRLAAVDRAHGVEIAAQLWETRLGQALAAGLR